MTHESNEGPRVSEDYHGIGRVLVIIPTYNEADNVAVIVGRVRAAVPAVHVLVADDNSPDGTGAIVDGIAAADNHVHVLHRAGKQGLGAAYLAGFAWAEEHHYDVVVEMDADGSHAPEELPVLLDALADADVVLGSRWVPGGKVVNWPAHRLALSRGGNLYVRLMLGMPLKDATGGYRAYRMTALSKTGSRDGRLAGLLFPGRPRLAGPPQRLPGGRGADHVRRTRAWREQDEFIDRARGTVAGDGVGHAVAHHGSPAGADRASEARGRLTRCVGSESPSPPWRSSGSSRWRC